MHFGPLFSWWLLPLDGCWLFPSNLDFRLLMVGGHTPALSNNKVGGRLA